MPTVVRTTLLDSGMWEVQFSDNTIAIVPAVIPTDFSAVPPAPNFGTGGGGGGGGAVTVADGADVAEGHTTDAATVSSVIGLLKAVKAAVQGTLTANTTIQNASLPVTSVDGGQATIGTTTDLVSTNTLVGLLKAIKAAVQGTLAITGTVTSNAGTNLNTSALALETGGNLATLAGAVSATKVKTTVADGDNATIGAKADAKSIATDATPVSIMSVLKQISASVQGTLLDNIAQIGGNVVATIGDAIAATGFMPVLQGIFNGTTYDRWRTANIAAGTTGLGVPANGNLVFDGINWQKQQGNTSGITKNLITQLFLDNFGMNMSSYSTLTDAYATFGTILAVAQGIFNGTTLDRLRSANAGAGTTGTGVPASGNLVFDGTNWQKLAWGYQAAASSLPVVTATPANSTDSQVSVLTSSGTLLATRAKRIRAVFKNTDAANPVFINFSNGTATTSNFPLKAGESVEMRGTGATTAISTGGTVVVAVIEEYHS